MPTHRRLVRRPTEDASDDNNEPSSPLPSSSSMLPLTSSPPRGDVDLDEDLEEIIPVDIPDDTQYAEEDSEGGEDLFGSDMENDYRAMPHLDVYDTADVDDTAYAPLSMGERRAVDDALRRRDREEGRRPTDRRGRLPAAFLDSDDTQTIGSSSHLAKKRRRAPMSRADRAIDTELTLSSSGVFGDDDHPAHRFIDDDEDEDNARHDLGALDDLSLDNLRNLQGPSLREWVTREAPRRALAKAFRQFLTTYVDEHDRSVYAERIKHLCESNSESLDVSYLQLQQFNAQLAMYLVQAPSEMLRIFDEQAMHVVLQIFPDYARIHSEIHVRMTDVPTLDALRDLRHVHLNCLVRVQGVVTRRTSVFPQLKYIKYNCVKCGHILGPYYQDSTSAEVKVGSCPECQSKGPFTVNAEQTVYRNYQKITLQESPGSVPAGRLPRQKDVILLWDLVDRVRPGELIELVGIYKNNFDASLNTRHGFPVFATLIEANALCQKSDQFSSTRLTEEDLEDIRTLSQDPRIAERIFKSIAPSIYGHEDMKVAVALALFGGVAKEHRGHRVRGDINVLLLGDPGTAKSQMLKYVEQTSHRVVYTTGQGASAVGLTASVRKDAVTREWTLEGGALVLADQGVCLIDEFDKMNDQDRTSIHEAMEQQTISISKAGIVTTLQARCSVIAAANPIKGRYDASVPFSENVALTEPILSRFDVLCVVKDVVDRQDDARLARFVVQSHARSHPGQQRASAAALQHAQDPDLLSQTTLKKYMMYAREHCHPVFAAGELENKLSAVYAALRAHAREGSMPVTARHIDAMVRLSEAHAKVHLRDDVRQEDVDMAIRVVLESFIQAQKFSLMKSLKREFSRYITYRKDANTLLYYVLQGLQRETLYYEQMKRGRSGTTVARLELDSEEFEMRARELQLHAFNVFYESDLFRRAGYTYEPERKIIVKASDISQ